MDTACLWIGRIVVGCGALAATAAVCGWILNFVYMRLMDHAVFFLVLKDYHRKKAADGKDSAE